MGLQVGTTTRGGLVISIPSVDGGERVGHATGVAATDQAAIVAAINRVPAIGGTVHLQPGENYHISGDLTVVKDYVTFDGHGATIMTDQAVTDNKQALWFIGSGWHVRDVRIVFANQITSNNKPGGLGNGDALRIGRVAEGFRDRATVENVTVDGGYSSGIQVNYVDSVIIRGCRVLNTNGNGIGVSNCREKATIIANHVDNTGDDGIAVVTDSSVSGGTKRVVIAENIVLNCDAKGIGTTGVDYCLIKGNHVRNTWTFGIGCFQDSFYNLSASNRCIIEGNTVEKTGYSYGATRRNAAASTVPYGINVADVPQAKVRGNLVIDSLKRGIQVSGTCPDVEVSGNTVITSVDAGINVGDADGADYTAIVGAIIKGNLVRQVGGGIIGGRGQRWTVEGNIVSSYKNGQSGSRRGIQIGRVQNAQIHGNHVVNDDSGNETIFAYNSCVNVRKWGNFENASGTDVDDGGVPVITVGSRRIGFNSAAPTSGTWQQGDVIFDTTAGNTAPQGTGWICRAAGSPGTWRKFGSVGVVPLNAFVAWDPPACTDGSVVSTSVTVSGALLGDSVAVGFDKAIPAGAMLTGAVTGNDTVQVTLFNKTGASLDVAAGNVRVTVWRHNAG